MYDLAGLAVAAGCFAFAFFLIWAAREDLMSAGDLIGLVISLLLLLYLLYALFRGENL